MIQDGSLPCCSKLGKPLGHMFNLWCKSSWSYQNQLLNMLRMLQEQYTCQSAVKYTCPYTLYRKIHSSIKTNHLESIFWSDIPSKRVPKQNKVAKVFGFAPLLKGINKPIFSLCINVLQTKRSFFQIKIVQYISSIYVISINSSNNWTKFGWLL